MAVIQVVSGLFIGLILVVFFGKEDQNPKEDAVFVDKTKVKGRELTEGEQIIEREDKLHR